jgi:hypothetical protein
VTEHERRPTRVVDQRGEIRSFQLGRQRPARTRAAVAHGAVRQDDRRPLTCAIEGDAGAVGEVTAVPSWSS